MLIDGHHHYLFFCKLILLRSKVESCVVWLHIVSFASFVARYGREISMMCVPEICNKNDADNVTANGSN